MREYPVLAKSLGETKWAFRDIKKEIDQNEEFLSVAQDAIKLSPSGWRAISATISDPAMVLEMDEHVRSSFTDMLINLTSKLQKPEKVKEFMGKFVRNYGAVSPVFLKTLEICIEKLPVKQLTHLTPEFVKNTSPEVVEHLCPMIEFDSDNFSSIVRSWKEQTTEDYETILSNGVIHQPQFHKLWKVGVEYGGIDGLLAMIRAYHDKKKECAGSTVGNKTVTIEPDFQLLKKAMDDGKTEDFLNTIKSAFIAKAKTMNI
jgi:hypothetical protein